MRNGTYLFHCGECWASIVFDHQTTLNVCALSISIIIYRIVLFVSQPLCRYPLFALACLSSSPGL